MTHTALKILALAAVVGLSGCGHMPSPEQLNAYSDSLAAAGCSGELHDSVDVTSAAGMSPGSWALRHKFDGKCDPAKAKAKAK